MRLFNSNKLFVSIYKLMTSFIYFFSWGYFLLNHQVSLASEEKTKVEVVSPQSQILPQKSRALRGLLLEMGTKNPLADVNVFILPYKLKATTDPQGYFKFESVPEGKIQIIINQTGYRKLEVNREFSETLKSSVEADQGSIETFYLRRESYSGFETTILGEKEKKDPSMKRITQAQFLTLPGSNGDPVRAVQNLPGVNRVAGFSSQVVIQGSAPGDTSYDIEGHRVPIIFHFGGLTSVVMPESVENVDYFAAGYGPEYSKALGGIVSLKTKNPDSGPHSYKGFYFIDTLKSGLQLEGRSSDKSSYLFSGRYSYIGLLFKQIAKNESDFSLTVAPEFADITSVYKYQINDQETFKMTTVASRDVLSFLSKKPNPQDSSVRGNFSNDTSFFRLIPKWHKKVDLQTDLDFSVGVGQDKILIDVGDKYFRLNSYILTTRGEFEKKIQPNWKSTIGFDNQYTRYNIDVRLPVSRSSGGISNPAALSEVKEVGLNGKTSNLGVYWRNEWVPDQTPRWTWIPSLRLDRFSLTQENLLAPRITGKFKETDSVLWRVSYGSYYQPPAEQESSDLFGNPDIKSPRADHYYLGIDKDFRNNTDQGFILGVGYFRRNFSRLVVQSSETISREGVLVPEIFNNSGKGMAHGLEILLKREGNPVAGWISYTLSRSTRWDMKNSEYPYEYDQTHNVNLVGSYDFSNDYKLSGRWRFVTGNPLTPIIGASFDTDNDVYIPRRGSFFSQRKKDFQQLDLRLDKKILTDRNIYTLYFDIQNILNHKNPEAIQYSYDYSEQQEVMGLPMLISVGFKGEF